MNGLRLDTKTGTGYDPDQTDVAFFLFHRNQEVERAMGLCNLMQTVFSQSMVAVFPARTVVQVPDCQYPWHVRGSPTQNYPLGPPDGRTFNVEALLELSAVLPLDRTNSNWPKLGEEECKLTENSIELLDRCDSHRSHSLSLFARCCVLSVPAAVAVLDQHQVTQQQVRELKALVDERFSEEDVINREVQGALDAKKDKRRGQSGGHAERSCETKTATTPCSPACSFLSTVVGSLM